MNNFENKFAFFGFILLIASISFALTSLFVFQHQPQNEISVPEELYQDGEDIIMQNHDETITNLQSIAPMFIPDTQAGSYLSAFFAQRHHDWDKAYEYLQLTTRYDMEDPALLRRHMIAAMAAGEYESGFEIAGRLQNVEDDNALSRLFLALQSIKTRQYNDAAERIDTLGGDVISDFFRPILGAWVRAGQGAYDVQDLNDNIVYLYHAVAIAHYLERIQDRDALMGHALRSGDMQAVDLERLADLYAIMGETQQARALYEEIHQFLPHNRYLLNKIDLLDAPDEQRKTILQLRSPLDGIALALYDTARLLHNEYSDDSASVFSSMALYLNPDLTEARLLMAAIARRQDHPDVAITKYQSVPVESPYFEESQLRAAEILESNAHYDRAEALLTRLIAEQDSLEARIRIGDLQRRQKDYEQAILHYNQAEEALGGHISSDYWHIHYLRGMAYERAGQWENAEKDLLAALEYRPNDPHVLNYLGYSWADQGKNLEEALIMIRQAVRLLPDDGYITDSLGWVLYRMGQFDQAIPHLERAVELLPYDPIINDHLGDAYYQVGRKLEARFQWQRALNHAEEEDEELKTAIRTKLEDGMQRIEPSSTLEAKNTRDDTPL